MAGALSWKILPQKLKAVTAFIAGFLAVMVGSGMVTLALCFSSKELFALFPLLMVPHYREIKTMLLRLIPGNIFNLMLFLTMLLRACLVSFKSYFKSVTFSYTKMKIF
jgi:hypothetical protein